MIETTVRCPKGHPVGDYLPDGTIHIRKGKREVVAGDVRSITCECGEKWERHLQEGSR